MPTYDYKCKACGRQFEQFQSMSADTLRKCPKCGKSKLERLIGTGAAVLFKGSGFYITDYRSDSYKKAAAADSKPAATPTAATDSKSPGESQPATESKPTTEAKPASPAKPDKPAAKKKSKDR